jgi:hypothetical protein
MASVAGVVWWGIALQVAAGVQVQKFFVGCPIRVQKAEFVALEKWTRRTPTLPSCRWYATLGVSHARQQLRSKMGLQAEGEGRRPRLTTLMSDAWLGCCRVDWPWVTPAGMFHRVCPEHTPHMHVWHQRPKLLTPILTRVATPLVQIHCSLLFR